MTFKSTRRVRFAESFSTRRFRGDHIVFACALLCLLLFYVKASCVPASPEPALHRQPDGTTFWARKIGDEHSHLIETNNGYTILRDAISRRWFYAIRSHDGKLQKSPYVVGRTFPGKIGIRKHLRPLRPRPKEKALPRRQLKSASSPPSYQAKQSAELPGSGSVQPAGSPTVIKNLVILARFSDHAAIFARDDFDPLFNENGYYADGAYGSVRDYYLEASHGKVQIDTTVADWVVLPHEEAYYGANDASGNDLRRQQMAEDAVQALDDTGFDFSPFDGDGDGYIDMLTIIHSGLGEEFSANPDQCIWSHMGTLWPYLTVDGLIISQYCTAPERRYNTTSIVRIGVICHEMGHLLGLPDLYDTDLSSSGIGVWGIMAAGSWGGNGSSPERPVHFCSWSKIELGWLTPIEIDASDSPVTVPQIEETSSPVVYRISCEMGGGEYLLIENRQKRSYDARLPSGGLLIWHIDDNKPDNDDETDHYMVALLQADGRSDLENTFGWGDSGDPFPGSTANRSLTPDTNPATDSYFNGDTYISVTNISDSADEMTFNLSTLVNIYSQHFSGGLPADWTVVDGYSDAYTWTDQNPGSRSNSNWSGTFMIADSAWAGTTPMDEELITPPFDCSDYTHVRIQFSHYFNASRNQTGNVDVKVNGGQWQNVARYVSANDGGLKNIDISAHADGKSPVQIRWHFYDARRDRYWGIDNVSLRGLPPVNEPPQISITTIAQRQNGSGHLDVAFTGTDPENDPATWVSSECQFAPYPYSDWQLLSFDTDDPAHTADEPMPFTAAGESFVAVIDASAWNGSYKIELRVSDGANQSLPAVSGEFSVDNAPPEVSVATHLNGDTPQSGATSVTAESSWTDPNLDTTWFSLKVNDGTWMEAIAGSPVGKNPQSATFDSVNIDGDDYLTAKSCHVDDFGNQSEESISSPYYITPMVPSAPRVDSPTPSSLLVAVIPNPAESGDVHYAVSCLTVKKYVDYATGTFADSPVWGNHAQWNGDAGITVVGLSSKTTYTFNAVAANPLDHSAKSENGASASATTTNTPPSPPTALDVSPTSPVAGDDLICSVTPADPLDADPGDRVSYLYTWSCSGKSDVVHGPSSELTDMLPASYTQKGDTWTCTVQAYDQFDYSDPLTSNGRLIGNSPPYTPASIALSPDLPKTGDDLFCDITPAEPPDPDPSDTVSYRYTWSCSGKQDVVNGPKSSTSDSLPSSLTEKGDSWTCRVEACDGQDWSSPLSVSMTILNTPPNQPQTVTIMPLTARTDDDLVCTLTPANPPDADPNDTVAYLYTWSCPGKENVVNGPRTGTSDTLSASLTDKGDVWSCSVRAFDETDYAEPSITSKAISNTPPNPPSQVTLTPQAPISTDDITCTVLPADPPDADASDRITYTYTWNSATKTVVAGPADALMNTLPAAYTAKGELWTCTVVATDGEANSAEISSSAAILNSPPSIGVSGALAVYEFSPVNLTIEASDADGDALTLACQGAPDGASFTDAGDGTATFDWLPTSAGNYDGIQFIADDGETQTSQLVSITVAPVEFRIVYIGLEPVLGEEESLVFMWFGIPNATYSVFRSQDLLAWECIASGLSLPSGSQVGDWLTYREPMNGSLATRFYYRVTME